MKKIIWLIVAVILLTMGNITLYLLERNSNAAQVSLIGFVIVWLDLILSIIVYSRQNSLAYIFLGVTTLIEILLTVNLFWILGRVL